MFFVPPQEERFIQSKPPVKLVDIKETFRIFLLCCNRIINYHTLHCPVYVKLCDPYYKLEFRKHIVKKKEFSFSQIALSIFVSIYDKVLIPYNSIIIYQYGISYFGKFIKIIKSESIRNDLEKHKGKYVCLALNFDNKKAVFSIHPEDNRNSRAGTINLTLEYRHINIYRLISFFKSIYDNYNYDQDRYSYKVYLDLSSKYVRFDEFKLFFNYAILEEMRRK